MGWGGCDVGDDINRRMCRSGLMFYFPDCGQSQRYINAHCIQDTTPSNLLLLIAFLILPFSLLAPTTIDIAPLQ